MISVEVYIYWKRKNGAISKQLFHSVRWFVNVYFLSLSFNRLLLAREHRRFANRETLMFCSFLAMMLGCDVTFVIIIDDDAIYHLAVVRGARLYTCVCERVCVCVYGCIKVIAEALRPSHVFADSFSILSVFLFSSIARAYTHTLCPSPPIGPQSHKL